MTGSGQLIEVQMSAEGSTYSRDQMNHLMDLAEKGVAELVAFRRPRLHDTQVHDTHSDCDPQRRQAGGDGALVAPFGVSVVGAAEMDLPEPEETETTFVGNARIKAHAAAKATGLPALPTIPGLRLRRLKCARASIPPIGPKPRTAAIL